MIKRVLIVFGTRPEAIKMAPLVKQFLTSRKHFETLVCVTAQHREMLDQVLSLFEIVPDFDLNIMHRSQDLYDVTSRVLMGIRDILDRTKPDIVLVHGDTTTSVTSALAAFYKKIPVGHVEAGLRTHNIYSPWPEEMNRMITSKIATYHFCPTDLGKQNLINEGINGDSAIVTGNTVIDAFFSVIELIKKSGNLKDRIAGSIADNGYDIYRLKGGRKMVLITSHRRENLGEGLMRICQAIKKMSEMYPGIDFVFPVHPNPNIKSQIEEVFNSESSENSSNLFFINPLEYLSFVFLMEKSFIILTDSGGIQEEAPGLGIPVLVLRDTTERSEAIEAGTVKLVGSDYDRILDEVSLLIRDKMYYDKFSKSINPYGDGKASQRIVEFLKKTI